MFYKFYMHFLVIVQRFEHFYVIALYKLKYNYYYYLNFAPHNTPRVVWDMSNNFENAPVQHISHVLCMYTLSFYNINDLLKLFLLFLDTLCNITALKTSNCFD